MERERCARKGYHASGDRVVAFIEIVSPGNKHSQLAVHQFLEKLANALRQGRHLLVIDLRPPGKPDSEGLHLAFWDPRQALAPSSRLAWRLTEPMCLPQRILNRCGRCDTSGHAVVSDI